MTTVPSRDRNAPESEATPASDAVGQQRIERAREVLQAEARAISGVEELVGDAFVEAVGQILGCQGVLVVTGMGKAGIIGQKCSATFASTGQPSIFLHPAEALHGDLGRIRSQDCLLALSNSGGTVEINRVIPVARKIGAHVIAMTGNVDSSLARLADVVLDIGRPDEACPLGLAPTTSTAAMLALGDALAMVVQAERNFSREDYALFHPAGALGRSLMRVEEIMRQGTELPLVGERQTVREVLLVMTDTPGRPGAALVVDDAGKLTGIFTDGDVRRLLNSAEDAGNRLETTIDAFMGKDPVCARPEQLVEEARHMLVERRKDQLPVVDDEGRPVGLLDVQDILDVRL